MTMPDYIEQHDQVMATRLVVECLRRGYVVSVNDGECWTVKKSANQDEILSAMGSTGEDILKVRKPGAEPDDVAQFIGVFEFIWGNGPGETIADHTANDECESLFTHANLPYANL